RVTAGASERWRSERRSFLSLDQFSPTSADMMSISTAGTSMPSAKRNTIVNASFFLTGWNQSTTEEGVAL
ncbi:hypothetical protein, partial [Indiicoccus explosivorum]|uniref:hypothetical protein n=1 Tax=Indiicoccus explosivorum TaxID=1917864 RepID=UPI0019D3F38F